MIRLPPRPTRPHTLFPYPTLFRSALGCVGPARLRHQRRRADQRKTIDQRLATTAGPAEVARAGAPVKQDGVRRSLAEWLRFPDVALDHLVPVGLIGVDADILAEAIEDARYAPYLERQTAATAGMRASATHGLPRPPHSARNRRLQGKRG